MILNIDLDFFQREEVMWDWGHSESNFGMSNEALWQIRALGFAHMGGDIEKETNIDGAGVHPSDFLKKLQECGFTFDADLPIVVSNSHMYAYPQLTNWMRGGPCFNKILSFDAHHDMGYKPVNTMAALYKSGTIDCADWQYHLLRRYKHLSGFQVYPIWRGLAELGGQSLKHLPSTVKKRFGYDVYSEDLLRRHAAPVTGIYIAKSESWFAPWHDHVVASAVDEMVTTLGARLLKPFMAQERIDPLRIRECDISQINAQASQLRQALGRTGT